MPDEQKEKSDLEIVRDAVDRLDARLSGVDSALSASLSRVAQTLQGISGDLRRIDMANRRQGRDIQSLQAGMALIERDVKALDRMASSMTGSGGVTIQPSGPSGEAGLAIIGPDPDYPLKVTQTGQNQVTVSSAYWTRNGTRLTVSETDLAGLNAASTTYYIYIELDDGASPATATAKSGTTFPGAAGDTTDKYNLLSTIDTDSDGNLVPSSLYRRHPHDIDDHLRGMYDSNPEGLGPANPGASELASRGDHVHPPSPDDYGKIELFGIYDVDATTLKVKGFDMKADASKKDVCVAGVWINVATGNATLDSAITISANTFIYIEMNRVSGGADTAYLYTGATMPDGDDDTEYFPLWYIAWSGGAIDLDNTIDLRYTKHLPAMA